MFKLPSTLSFYVGRHFLLNIAIVMLAICTLIMMLDAVELIRSTRGKPIGALLLVQLTLLKLPQLIQETTPFIILLAGILTFTRLTHSYELVVARASGVSVWQFLAPVILICLAIGLFFITIFNPISAILLTKYEKTFHQHFEGSYHTLAVSSSGLWLREYDDDTRERMIIHATHVARTNTELFHFSITFFDDNNVFLRRVDAKSAILEPGQWRLNDALFTAPYQDAVRKKTATIPTQIILEKLQNSFTPPEAISFWELPAFITTLEATGFSALKHKLHWHTILISPLFFCAMVFIAAAFSLSPPRQNRTGILITSGICVGFFIYYFSGLINALGESGNIPVILSAWAPVIFSIIIGMALMLHLEDG